LNDEKKARPDRPSVSEGYIYRNNQNMVAIFAIRPYADDNFLSRESNSVHMGYFSEKRMFRRLELF
jgi:hypothetical protein